MKIMFLKRRRSTWAAATAMALALVAAPGLAAAVEPAAPGVSTPKSVIVEGAVPAVSTVAPISAPLTACSRKPVWCRLAENAASGQSHLVIKTDRDRYVVGASIGISVDVPEDGYLYVIMVDYNDEMLLLYPNEYSMRKNPGVNWHRKGKFRLGKRCAKKETCLGFTLAASEPLGETLFVATVMKTPLDIERVLDKTAEKSASAGAVGESIYVRSTDEKPSAWMGARTVLVDAKF